MSSPAPSFGAVGSRGRERTPPPNPNRAWSLKCNTTSQGTPVPREPPPVEAERESRSPWGGLHSVPGFPSTAESTVHHHGSTGLGLGSHLYPHSEGFLGFRNELHGVQLPPPPFNLPHPCGPTQPPMHMPSHGVQALATPMYGPSGDADPGRDPWMGGVPTQVEGGRDPYAPGDRVYWTLPVLDDPSAPEAATRAADWLELVRPLMADLSQSSASWWQRVGWEARSLYARWTAMSAISWGLLIPTMSAQLSDIRF